MKFLCEGFQKLEHEQDKQTNATGRITTLHSPLTLSPPIPLRLYMLPNWSNPSFLIFDIRARMSKINKSSSGDEIPERDVTYHLLCLLIYH